MEYLPTEIGAHLCDQFIEIGAPPLLRNLTFLLHSWRLIRLPRVRRNAPLMTMTTASNKKMRLVVVSHGLSGSSVLYSDLICDLASHGYLVLAVNHSDESAIHVTTHKGVSIPYNSSILRLDNSRDFVEYVKHRRKQTQHRVEEISAATMALLDLHKSDSTELKQLGISLVDRLDVDKGACLIGHSFGGATVLAAAAAKTNLLNGFVGCVVALDPAVDWMPDYGRRWWLGSCEGYTGGTGGYSPSLKEPNEEKEIRTMDHITLVHPTVDSLFIYSEEWERRGWGGIHFIQGLYARGLLGCRKYQSVSGFDIRELHRDMTATAVSVFGVIRGSSHSAFSDICLLVPTWIARNIGLTGSGNPHHTSAEINCRILDFLSK